MIQIFKDLDEKEWTKVLSRPVHEPKQLLTTVQEIIEDIRNNGDQALKKLSLQFDGVQLDKIQHEIKETSIEDFGLDAQLIEAMKIAYKNIKAFHLAQHPSLISVHTAEGVFCQQKPVPIQKVGLYIPGGNAPLFSTTLMLAIPARIAGCKEIVLCTPPNKTGSVPKEILAACKLCGIDKVFLLGGAQAIAAMAFGTETIPAVYKIFGPGNQYVTMAKQWVSLHNVAIDMPAGPSELAVWADDTSNPVFVAADLLSQAEHGADSQVVLVSQHLEVLQAINQEIKTQVALLPRKEYALSALEKSVAILVQSQAEGVKILNEYAAEHLIIAIDNPDELAAQIVNAGSIFLGHFSPESAGDYASGTNHTLPTNGAAKAYSGVSLDSFFKKITLQTITPNGITTLGPHIEAMAMAEGLQAHKNAVTVRLEQLKS